MKHVPNVGVKNLHILGAQPLTFLFCFVYAFDIILFVCTERKLPKAMNKNGKTPYPNAYTLISDLAICLGLENCVEIS